MDDSPKMGVSEKVMNMFKSPKVGPVSPRSPLPSLSLFQKKMEDEKEETLQAGEVEYPFLPGNVAAMAQYAQKHDMTMEEAQVTREKMLEFMTLFFKYVDGSSDYDIGAMEEFFIKLNNPKERSKILKRPFLNLVLKIRVGLTSWMKWKKSGDHSEEIRIQMPNPAADMINEGTLERTEKEFILHNFIPPHLEIDVMRDMFAMLVKFQMIKSDFDLPKFASQYPLSLVMHRTPNEIRDREMCAFKRSIVKKEYLDVIGILNRFFMTSLKDSDASVYAESWFHNFFLPANKDMPKNVLAMVEGEFQVSIYYLPKVVPKMGAISITLSDSLHLFIDSFKVGHPADSAMYNKYEKLVRFCYYKKMDVTKIIFPMVEGDLVENLFFINPFSSEISACQKKFYRFKNTKAEEINQSDDYE